MLITGLFFGVFIITWFIFYRGLQNHQSLAALHIPAIANTESAKAKKQHVGFAALTLLAISLLFFAVDLDGLVYFVGMLGLNGMLCFKVSQLLLTPAKAVLNEKIAYCARFYLFGFIVLQGLDDLLPILK